MAAISRQADCGDASHHAWLRADPAYVRPDMGTVRLLACGDMNISADEAESFLKPLRPLFGDVGFPVSTGAPSRWFLMLPRESKIPSFATPAEAVGGDVFAHMPEGPEGRRWRSLLNEAQIVLHNHPLNEQRIAVGLLPVNSVWFWGGGVLPDRVNCSAQSVVSPDDELLALCRSAGVSTEPNAAGSQIIDCRRERNWSRFESDQLGNGLGQLGKRYARLTLDFADGTRFVFEPKQRWRLLRRAARKLA